MCFWVKILHLTLLYVICNRWTKMYSLQGFLEAQLFQHIISCHSSSLRVCTSALEVQEVFVWFKLGCHVWQKHQISMVCLHLLMSPHLTVVMYPTDCRIELYIVSQWLSQSQLDFVQLDDLRSHLCICAALLINDHQIEGRHQLMVDFTKLYLVKCKEKHHVSQL